MLTDKQTIISQLRKEILHLEGFKAASETAIVKGMEGIEAAFPNGVFPTGTIHEFVASGEYASACLGFISSLVSSLVLNESTCLWISTSRDIFPSSLKSLGIEPDRVIFIDLKRERDVLWATEEALKCEGLSVVVAELREISFAQSRRLQLATEKSRVTGFILLKDKKINSTPCTARWQVKSLQSATMGDLPGVGLPRWQVELLKIKNGNPCKWQFEWTAKGLIPVPENPSQIAVTEHHQKAG